MAGQWLASSPVLLTSLPGSSLSSILWPKPFLLAAVCLSSPHPRMAPGLSSCSPELMAGAKAPTLSLCCYQGMDSVCEHGTMWKKPPEVTPNSLLHHFDFHCVSCDMLGNSGLSIINQLIYMALRWVLGG